MLKFTTPVIFSIVLLSCSTKEKPLTSEESLAFGKEIERTMERRDPSFFDKSISADALFRKMDLPRYKVSSSFKSGAKKGMNLGTKILDAISKKGSYSLIKHYVRDSIHHLIFRLYDGGMLNYHDMELTRDKGEPKIADIYMYITAQNFSETLKGLFADLGDFADDRVDDNNRWIARLPEIRNLINKGKHEAARDIFMSVPLSIQNSRMFQIIYIEIASGLSDEEHMKAIEQYEKLYPNEPNMQLMLIDAYILRKQYDKALKAVNELDKMIDKDPLLDYYRAICYELMLEPEKSRAHLEMLVKNMPDFEDGLIQLIHDYLDSGEYDKARPLVQRYKNFSSFDQEALNAVLEVYPGYEE